MENFAILKFHRIFSLLYYCHCHFVTEYFSSTSFFPHCRLIMLLKILNFEIHSATMRYTHDLDCYHRRLPSLAHAWANFRDNSESPGKFSVIYFTFPCIISYILLKTFIIFITSRSRHETMVTLSEFELRHETKHNEIWNFLESSRIPIVKFSEKMQLICILTVHNG